MAECRNLLTKIRLLRKKPNLKFLLGFDVCVADVQ